MRSALDRARWRWRLKRTLVDLGDAIGDSRPGIALGALPRRRAHRRQALGLVVDTLQFLGETLWVAGRDQHSVDAIGDDVAVAGDGGGNRRGTRGEGLGEDHAEALAGERGGAEQIGLAQRRPEALAGDTAAHVDPAHRLGIGQVAQHVLALGADHGEAAGHVLDQRFESGQQHRQALALLGAADEQHPQLATRRLWAERRGVDVDAIRNHLVVPAEPAAPRPGGCLGDRDPGREPVQDPPSAQRRSEVVGDRLGRVGVEGPDRRDGSRKRSVPADQRHDRLVDMDHVVAALTQLATRGDDAARREGGEVGDRAIGREPRSAAHRDQIVGHLAGLRGRAVKRPAEPIWGIEGGEHTHVVTATEKLLGKRLDVPVHAALVAPGIWRD